MSINTRALLEPGCDQLIEQSNNNSIVAKYLHLRDTELSLVPIVYLYQQMAIELAEENTRLKKAISVEPCCDSVRMVIELPLSSFTHVFNQEARSE